MESAVTRDVEIRVESFYLEEQSAPEQGRYVFAYRVQMRNLGDDTVQLLRRHWIITDSTGRINEVRGEGVVGEQPTLAPGEAFEYVSGSHLESPMGTMEGTYEFVGGGGEHFDVRIPVFTLAVPSALN